MDKFIGALLEGKYEILELAGSGGMARVYKARDVSEDRIVGLKILKEEYAGNSEFLRRFRNESRAIALLSHPNIVKIFDVGFSDKLQFIVMEYVDGITLKQYMENKRRLDTMEAVNVTIEVLKALEHAHSRGIIHRDIKPQNIMISPDGAVKVMDFGIARFAQSQTMTMTDKAIGSVHYISPEQARGDTITEKADIYSLGVMLFEMLTGSLPFDADTAVSVAIKQIEATPIKPREINPDIPVGLEEIILKAMQKDASNRYNSTLEMLGDMRLFLQNPRIVFGYQYLEDKEMTRSYDKIKPPKPQKPAPPEPENGNEDEEEEVEYRKSPVLSILTGVAIAFVVAAALFVLGIVWIINPFEKSSEILAPNLIGLSLMDDVKNNPKYENLDIRLEKSEYNSDYQKGMIFYQSPQAGRGIKPGTTIYVRVSEGSDKVMMPDVVNLTLDEAKKRLDEQKLRYTEMRVSDETIAEGFIVRTVPEKNSPTVVGTIVELYVSKGSKAGKVDVPDFHDVSLSRAKQILEELGLKLGETAEVESSKPKDVIVSQYPEEGTQVDEGTKINFDISAGGRNSSRSTGGSVMSLSVTLPQVNRNLTVEVFQDGVSINVVSINPSQYSTLDQSFTGKDRSNVDIYIDNKLYHGYILDFTEGVSTLTRDNSYEFKG